VFLKIRKIKKWQAYYIAPLQPLTLAAFLPWEGSAGAGRVRPAAANISLELKLKSLNYKLNPYKFW